MNYSELRETLDSLRLDNGTEFYYMGLHFVVWVGAYRKEDRKAGASPLFCIKSKHRERYEIWLPSQLPRRFRKYPVLSECVEVAAREWLGEDSSETTDTQNSRLARHIARIQEENYMLQTLSDSDIMKYMEVKAAMRRKFSRRPRQLSRYSHGHAIPHQLQPFF